MGRPLHSLSEAESDHRMLFLQHLKYAHQTNALERCSRFLRSLDGEDRWVHTGEYTGACWVLEEKRIEHKETRAERRRDNRSGGNWIVDSIGRDPNPC